VDRHRRFFPARFERETGLLSAIFEGIVNQLSNSKDLISYLEYVV
jgi:hypothetical protein